LSGDCNCEEKVILKLIKSLKFYKVVLVFIIYKQKQQVFHPKIKITPWFTPAQAIIGLYDFLLSDK